MWDFRGKTCSYCQSPIKEGTSLIVCPHCEMPHHYECRRENGGCTTFGCVQQAAAEGVQHVPVATSLDQSYYEQRPSSQYQLEATLLAGQYRLAGFCARFGAYLVDMIPCIIVAAIIGDDSGLLVTTLYSGILQGQTGHTLGKSMLGLKVIRTNGEPISMRGRKPEGTSDGIRLRLLDFKQLGFVLCFGQYLSTITGSCLQDD